MDNKETLRELGLTEGEVKVYYSLFELGETTVGPISKKSGVTHAKVYPILNKLIEKGLVSHVIKEGRKTFSPTNPNSLLDFIDKKVKNLEDEKNEIKKIIPSLLAKQKTQEKTQYSRVFEGFRGLRALFQELFNQNPKKEVMVFGLDDMLSQAGFVSFFNFYHELRKNKRIVTKIIFQKSVKKIIDEKYSSNVLYSKMDKVKYLDIVFPTGVFIFEDHVITIVSEKNITAFDIKSGQNTERYRQFFNSIWKN